MRKLTKEQFMDKANKLHQNKFDYSKFIYVHAKIKGIIICPIHGEFIQCPDKHTKKNSYGCFKCYLDIGKQINNIERFNKKLSMRKTKKGCINWLGHMNTTGYGIVVVKGIPIVAHRFSWELHNGKIQDGLYCLHKCDNRKCVNIDHLFLGTLKDNYLDMVQKGRAKINIPKGI